MTRRIGVIGFIAMAASLWLPQSGPAAAPVSFRAQQNLPSTARCWHRVPSPNGTDTNNNYLEGVDGVSSNDLWAVGLDQGVFPNEGLIEHYDGSSWTVSAQINIGAGGTALYAVHAVSSNDVWSVGYFNRTLPLVEHWDGTGWFISETPVPGVAQSLVGVAAASSTDVWAVGDYNPTSNGPTQTLAFHWNGTGWTQVQTPSPGSFANQLNAIDVVSSNDVWAVGVYSNSNGTVATLTEHWDGTTWSVVPSPAPSLPDLTAVTTIASDDVWAVGSGPNGGFSIHWDGATWTTVAMPLVGVEDYLHGLAHTSSSDVWAVGEAAPNFESWQALALHWNGVRWTPVKAPSGPQEAHFYGVTDFTPSDAWAVGSMVPFGGIESTLTERLVRC